MGCLNLYNKHEQEYANYSQGDEFFHISGFIPAIRHPKHGIWWNPGSTTNRESNAETKRQATFRNRSNRLREFYHTTIWRDAKGRRFAATYYLGVADPLLCF